MKKFLLSVLGALMALPGLAENLRFSYEYEGQTLVYEIIDENARTCRASRDGEIVGNLVIPEVAKDGDIEYKVVEFEGMTFFANEHLTSVTIPGSITEVGAYVFGDCRNLTSVVIQEGVVTIDEAAFTGCSLVEIVLPESLTTIGDYCFGGGDQSVKFGSNIESIGRGAFSISQFTANDKLKYLGDKAFGDNFRLLKINGNTPPELASANMGYSEDAAYNILVIVPANGDDAYKNDPKWNGFHVVETAPTKTVYMTGKYSLAEEIATTTQQMPGNVTSLAIVGALANDDWNIIKRNLISCYDLDLSGVTNTEIPAEVFADNQHLLTLKLPRGLKTIGESTFKGCRNLTIDELPASIEVIGDYAFSGCTMLDVEALPESLHTIGANAFENCQRLKLTALPAVESLGEGAFSNCPRFMELDMSAAKITVIEPSTFSGCGKLRNVVLPETLKSIGAHAFVNTAVNFIEFPAGLLEIGEEAFSTTPLISVELPRKFTTLGQGSFYDCSKIKSVSFPTAMTTIGNMAFKDCRGIKSISVPRAEPPTVGDDAFSNVRYRDVVVAIPTMNYRDYLNALGWGAFTQLANSIFLDYEEVDENGNKLPEEEADEENIETGAMENGTYDETVENIVGEEEQAAEDAARDEALYGEEPQTPAEVAARVRRARAEARAAAEATAGEKARKAFTRLYSGLSMTIGDNKGYRVKIEPKEGVEIVKIEFGGKDITNTYVDGMVELPMLYSKSDLKVYRKASNSGVSTNFADRTATSDVYNFQGIRVLRDATEAQVRSLAPGLYIYKGRKIAIN